MLLNLNCNELCPQSLKQSDIDNFEWMIEHDYKVNMMIDNIPAIYKDENGTYNVGFPIGYKSSINAEKDTYYIYNHLEFEIHYHPTHYNDKLYNVVEFYITPYSYNTHAATTHDK